METAGVGVETEDVAGADELDVGREGVRGVELEVRLRENGGAGAAAAHVADDAHDGRRFDEGFGENQYILAVVELNF